MESTKTQKMVLAAMLAALGMILNLIEIPTKTEGGRWKIEMHFCRKSVQKLLFVSVTQASGSLIPACITQTEGPLME